jgi:restriction system protein
MLNISFLPERFIIFDLETTGLDPTRHEIIEIGAIRANRDSDQHETFRTLVKPLKKIPKAITEFTGISQEMVDREGDPLETAIKEFAAFIGDLPLVAFNAEFHLAFLKSSAEQYGLFIGNPVACALKMARNAWPRMTSYKLEDLARDGGLSLEGLHRSLNDCVRVSLIYTSAASVLGYSGFVESEQISEGGMKQSKMTTEVGHLQARYGARGSVSYSIEVRHPGLHKHRLVRGPDSEVVQAKVRLQVAEWEELWAKRQSAEQRTTQVERKREEAAERTAKAQAVLQSLRDVLSSSLAESKAVDWEALKDRTPFPKPKPQPPPRGGPPEQDKIPEAPSRTSPKYQPQLGLLDKFWTARRMEKEAAKAEMFELDMRAWEAARDHILADHASKLDAHNKQQAFAKAAYAQTVRNWEAERDAFIAQETQQHEAMDAFRARYMAKEPAAMIEYCDLVLSNSDYPECFPKESDFDFNPDTGVLVVSYRLPAQSDLPTLTEVKYVHSTDSFTEKHLSEANAAKLYDDCVYQVALRTMNELLESDQANALTGVVFNGFVTAIDKGIGKEVTACIISVQASKETLRAINLDKVDPKACFRQLKGVGSSKLHSVTPVAPIITIRRDDERFVEAYGVAETLSEGCNLAAMDWEDFEHLIREIFEKEFTSSGGEVRVTQASRDGGVDAVAFDPDPIRGGKIVIQAKRYAYTVGVSAVRDLYGTLMNEGPRRAYSSRPPTTALMRTSLQTASP